MAAPSTDVNFTPVLDVGGPSGGVARLLDQLEMLAGGPARAVVLHGLETWADPIAADQLAAFSLTALPLIVAFEGELAGPALDLALGADIRVAGAGASIRARNIGSRRLLALLGPIASVDLLRERGLLDANGLLTSGLVSDVAPTGDALAAALAIASTIASRGPIATRFAKEALWRGLDLPFDQALRFETDLTLLLQTTKDRGEGVRAFIEKRPPIFTGD